MLRLLNVRKIWDRAPHNAFTDLIRFRDRWYCAFREGTAHVSDDGKGRILVSADGERWDSAALLEADGDVRDPKLCIMPDGRLMAVTAAACYHRQSAEAYAHRDPHQSLAWFSPDGAAWSAPVEIGDRNWWLWRVTWHRGFAYGVAREAEIRRPRLYRSADGVQFDCWVDELLGPDNQARGSEATLLFLPDDRALCLIRGRDPAPALLGRADPPYDRWQWQVLADNIGGPNLLRLADGRILAAGRHFGPERETWLWWLDTETGALTPALALPSGGDTSYPGLVEHEGMLWVSYYSGHEGHCAIYLAQVALDG